MFSPLNSPISRGCQFKEDLPAKFRHVNALSSERCGRVLLSQIITCGDLELLSQDSTTCSARPEVVRSNSLPSSAPSVSINSPVDQDILMQSQPSGESDFQQSAALDNSSEPPSIQGISSHSSDPSASAPSCESGVNQIGRTWDQVRSL